MYRNISDPIKYILEAPKKKFSRKAIPSTHFESCLALKIK